MNNENLIQTSRKVLQESSDEKQELEEAAGFIVFAIGLGSLVRAGTITQLQAILIFILTYAALAFALSFNFELKALKADIKRMYRNFKMKKSLSEDDVVQIAKEAEELYKKIPKGKGDRLKSLVNKLKSVDFNNKNDLLRAYKDAKEYTDRMNKQTSQE